MSDEAKPTVEHLRGELTYALIDLMYGRAQFAGLYKSYTAARERLLEAVAEDAREEGAKWAMDRLTVASEVNGWPPGGRTPRGGLMKFDPAGARKAKP